MSLTVRVMLLIGAALCGGFVFVLGSTTSLVLEPDRFSSRAIIFWLIAGLFVSIPLWLPAVVPNKFPVAQKFCRWASAVVLLLPTYLFSTIVSHNLGKSMLNLRAEPLALIQGVVLTSVCVIGIVILLRQDLLAIGKKGKGAPNA